MKHETPSYLTQCVLCFDLPRFKTITQVFPAEQGEVACLFGHNSPPGVSIKIIDVFSDSKYPGITDGSNLLLKTYEFHLCYTWKKKTSMKLRAPNFWAWGTHSKWGFEEMKYVAHTSLWHYNACLVGKDVQRKLSRDVQGDLGAKWDFGWWLNQPTLKNMNVNLENLPQIGVKICLKNIGNHHL